MTDRDLTRRSLIARAAGACLGVGALGLMPSWVPLLGDEPATTAPPRRRPTAKNLITLFMAGGMSHLDTFDPKPGAAEQGATQVIDTPVDGVRVSEHFPRLALQMPHLALIRSMSSTQGAHEQGQYFMHTSFVQRGGIRHPALGGWLAKLSPRINPALPSYVTVGAGGGHPGGGFLDAACAPLPLGDAKSGLPFAKRPAGVDEERFARRLALSDALDADWRAAHDQVSTRAYTDLYHEAVTLMGSSELAAFDLTKEPEALRARYGAEPFGAGCLLARRLVEHDVRAVEVQLGGWDTHDDNFDRVADQAAILDQAASALIADLASRGLLEETIVACVTEFGRTPKINDKDGRDHYPKAFSCWLAGGGIRGGVAYGATDERGATTQDAVQIPDLNATIAYALGLPLDQENLSPSGRPFHVADKGKPLACLF